MDTGILQPQGEYPNDWTPTIFDEFTTLKRGKDLTREQFRDGLIPVAGSNGVIGFHDSANVKGPGITVGRSGSVGRVTFFRNDFWAHNTALFVNNLHGNDARFAAFFLEFLELSRFGSGASVPTLDRNSFRLMPVIIPPISEQTKIAAILDNVQRATERQGQLITIVSELKKAVQHLVFTQGLRGQSQKHTAIESVPQGWAVLPLGDCATVQTGVAKGRAMTGKETIAVPYLRVANVQSGFLDLTEIKTITIQIRERPRFTLQDGDVVLTEGGDFDQLGRGFIWRGQISDCVHQNHIFAVRVDRARLIPEFFAHLSQSPYGKAYFLSVAHKTTNLACINTTKLKGFPVLIPSRDEQLEIITLLEAVDLKLSGHQRKRAVLNELFLALLQQLMTAQVRIRDIDLSALDLLME